MKKFIAFILAVLTMLTIQPGAVFAQTDTYTSSAPDSADTIAASESTIPSVALVPPAEEEADTQEHAKGSIPIDHTIPSYTPPSLLRAGELSAEYAPTHIPTDVPPARNQGGYGICWAHSVMLAVEMSMIQQKLATKDNVNLSELQLAWFHHKGPKKSDGSYDDPLNNFSGDYNSYNISNVFNGDNAIYAVRSLVSWMGPMQEDSKTAYSNASEIASSGLDYSYAFSKDAVHISEVRYMNMKDRNQIKQAILDYGAVIIEYKHNPAFFEGNYYYADRAPKTDAEKADHSVAIIGWDDNVPAGNFKVNPGKNGAWLVRNSWGDDWGDNGNFYMSYKSYFVSGDKDPATALKVAPLSDSDYCYQYDGTSSYGWAIPALLDKTENPKAANIFTAQHRENITAVSFWLDVPTDVKYTVRVYTGVNPNEPESGKLVATKGGKTDYSGYYTVTLDTPVPVENGELFSAVVTFENKTEKTFNIPVDAYDNFGNILIMHSYSEPGQSFVWVDDNNGWKDATEEAESPVNCRVKVFTKEAPFVPVESIEITADTDLMYGRSAYQLSAEVLPTNASNKAVEMSIVGESDVASVSPNGMLTTFKPGTVTVHAKALDGSGKYGDRTFTISEGDPILSKIEITRLPNKITYFKGSASDLDKAGLVVSAVFNDNSKTDVTDYVTLTGFSSSERGTNEVTATYEGHTAKFNVYIFGGKSMSISLEGTIAINLKAEFPDHATAGYTPGMLAFSTPPTDQDILNAYNAGQGLPYTTKGTETVFKYSKAAKEMSDKEYIVLFAASRDADGIEHVTFGTPSSKSVVDFANIAYTQFSSNRLIMTMLTDMLNYGAKAQEFFKHHTYDLANAGLTPEQKAYASKQTIEFTKTGARFTDALSSPRSQIDVAKFSLTLESEISINFYARIAGNVKFAELLLFDSYTPRTDSYYDYGRHDTIVPMTLQTTGPNAGRYLGSIPNIDAQSMRTPYYARFYAVLADNTVLYSDVMRYDIESHVNKIKNDPTYHDQWPLTEAMMRYGDSAKAYFDSTH